MNGIVIVVVALGLGFSLYTIANGVAGPPERRRGAPPVLRGLMLAWLALSLATLVLVGLGGFQHSDLKVLVVVFTILGLLAVFGHSSTRNRRSGGDQ
jgi:hypothetical protein